MYHSHAPVLKDYQGNLLQNSTGAKRRSKQKYQIIDIYLFNNIKPETKQYLESNGTESDILTNYCNV